MNTLFVYKRAGIDTAEIRGRQIASELGADSMCIRDLAPEMASRYEAVLYVKHAAEPRMLEEIQRLGVKQIWDPLDNYSSWNLRRRAPFMDAFLGANLTHAVHLQQRFGIPSVAIPHHHCNFSEQRIPFRSVPSLGFISTPGHWPKNRKLVKKLGYPVVFNVSRKGEQGFQRLVDAYLAVDIGFTWRFDENKLRFSCANKLTNFMSFGIPSVLTPESGYLEVGRQGETRLYAHTEQDFVSLVRHLAEDQELRRRMGDACREGARPFHISRIADRYREFLGSF